MTIRAFLLTIASWTLLSAGVTRVEIKERTEIPHAGYIRLAGVVRYAIDPKLPANRRIADIDHAPKNAQGLVEFSSDLLIYAPKDPKKSNGTLLLDIPNRGGVSIVSSMQLNARGRGISKEDLGDMFLFDQGFLMVWVGWQPDVPEGPGVIRLHPAIAKGVTGPVHSEILVDKKSTSESLGDRNMIPFAVADASTARLTVRDTPASPRKEIPHGQWTLDAAKGRVDYPAGFEPGKFYEVVYQGKDPAIAGLGMAAVRDYVSMARVKGVESVGTFERAIAYGNSQSGRFLRTYLYDGFNADEKGKKVFDGIWAHISGAARGSFNQRFAQPSRMSGQWNGVSNPVDLGPFAPAELLASSVKAGVAPKLMLTNGSHEYWGRAASLNHVSSDAAQDAAIPAGVRMYYLAGSQHSTAANTMGLRGVVQNQTNPLEWRWLQRALLVAMNAWIAKGTEPPPSQVPSVTKGELVAASAVKFPKVPGIATPAEAYSPRSLDFGPDFPTKGIASIEPAKEGPVRTALVPQVNADGNEMSGVVMPELKVPLATYTGWNLREPKAGPPGMYPLQGSMIPFARTKAEREKSGDPRLSIEERYRDGGEYLRRTEAIARDLALKRLVLEQDIPLIVARAKVRWDSFTATAVAK